MIGTILSILTGGGFKTIQSIASEMQQTKRAIALAENDADKVELEERSKILQTQLEVKERAQATFGAATLMRAGFALPFMAYLWKLIVYDKIIMGGLASTDALGQNEADLMKLIVSFYFLSEIGLTTYKAWPLLRRRQ